MNETHKKIFAGLIALLFVVTIVQSQAIMKLAQNKSVQQAQVTATKTDTSTKRADSLDTGIYANEGKKEDETIKEVTITCTSLGCDNGVTLPYVFQYNDVIDMVYCAGGGGGGGGGRGYDEHGGSTPGIGKGGAGGGGGQGGQCHSYENISVSPNATIAATIGLGGQGGIGAYKRLRYTPNGGLPNDLPANNSDNFSNLDTMFGSADTAATNGLNGGNTIVSISQPGGKTQTYTTAYGGMAGISGQTATDASTTSTLGGQGGSALLPVWHDGKDGVYGAVAIGIGPRGGAGGDGESPVGGGNSYLDASSGGKSGANNGADQFNNGRNGELSYGGGGGSGGFGDFQKQYGCGGGPSIAQGEPMPFVFLPAPTDLYNSLCRILQAGKGGKGGDGYVKLIGVKIPPPTEAKFTTAGTHTFNWNTVPVGATVTIKVWGAGGGGGNAYENSSTTVEDIVAAGGGAGGYAEHQMVNPGNGVVPIIIGEGGAPGNMGGGNGMPGGQSKFGTSIVANGGLGGVGDVEGNQNSGVIGGAGGVAWGGSVVNTSGPSGQSGTAGGLGGNVSTPQNDIADGGQGGIINNAAGNNLTTRNALAGKPGRVEISW